MTRRQYVQSRRAEAAEETRRRIVQATFQLHAEQGVAATSMKQIAQRAGVSVGTVYHHFPTYDEAIAACGAHAFRLAPPPDESAFEGAADARARVAALVRACHAQYRAMPLIEAVRAEQHVSPVLAQVFAEEAERRARLALRAVGKQGELARLAAGLLDIGVWSALVRAGLSQAETERLVTEFIVSQLPPHAP